MFPRFISAEQLSMSTTIISADQLLHDAEEGRVPSRSFAASQPTPFEWFFVITGGLALFLPLVWWIGEDELNTSERIQWYFWASALISSPHVYSTYVRQYRKTREGKISWWLGLPAYIAMVLLLVGVSYAGYFVEAITAVNVWQSFHYLRQTYGIGCLYGGQKHLDALDRRLRWWAYHLCFPWLILGRWDMLYQAWGGQSHDLIPMDIDDMLLNWLGLVALGGVYLLGVLEARSIWKNGRDYRLTGLICFIMFLGVHWYGFMLLSHYQRGFFTVTIFHALQYLALVWVLERKHYVSRGVKWIEMVPNLVGFLVFWAVLYGLGFGWEQKITVALTHWWLMASSILLAAISIHHYTVDSFLWRRSVGS
jgi:isoprenylcysteine carboxyl methyltransferase (ICMT) family protein YpbQ